jgi:hypothetical protein
MKKTIIWILSLMILAQIVFAGVTNPLPTELNLMKGESGRFKFQIQTIASNQEVQCVSSLAEESPLLIEFDPDEIIVPASTVREVRGTVTVPDEIEFGTFQEEFCISCRPTEGAPGSSVSVDTCGLPLKVNVVQERTRDNMYIPPKPGLSFTAITIIVLIIIIAGVLIAVILRRMRKRQETHEAKVIPTEKETPKETAVPVPKTPKKKATRKKAKKK